EQTFEPLTNTLPRQSYSKTFEQMFTQEEGFQMSLDLYLEADNALTAPTLRKALNDADAWEINVVGDSLEATFISGLTL
ncbi:hypothetical protein SB861_68755, partial [Paraburkholderia sp. SIMBA_049]